jgi:hypothetical protein
VEGRSEEVGVEGEARRVEDQRLVTRQPALRCSESPRLVIFAHRKVAANFSISRPRLQRTNLQHQPPELDVSVSAQPAVKVIESPVPRKQQPNVSLSRAYALALTRRGPKIPGALADNPTFQLPK